MREEANDGGTLRQYIHTNQVIGEMGTQLKIIGVKQDKGRKTKHNAQETRDNQNKTGSNQNMRTPNIKTQTLG